MLNSHKIFYDAANRRDFLAELNVSDKECNELAAARDLIRAELRTGFAAWQERLERRLVLSWEALRKSIPDPKLRPKFRMQGSAKYHTLNTPARRPPQQIDYDDGVYLPISFLSEGRNPILASKGYFLLVETILTPLCQRNGWKLQTYKNSCVRVELDGKAHIDLPLYAIPDDQFRSLTNSAMKSLAERAALEDGVDLIEEVYKGLSREEIRLAHREDGWIKSDPRLIEDWFNDAVDTHGDQLRRVCRYLKAWRDYHWNASPLTSITIMKCVVDAFDAMKGRLDS